MSLAGSLSGSRARCGVELDGSERGCETAAAGVLERTDVVDAAVAADVVCHCRGDGLAAEAGEDDVVGPWVGGSEKVGGDAGDSEVLLPVGRCEIDPRPRWEVVVEPHAHCARGRVERVAAALELVPHRQVALVHPGSEAIDACGCIRRLHRVDGVLSLPSQEVSLEECVIVNTTLGLVRKHGDGHAREALHGGANGSLGVLLPRRDQGGGAERVETGVGLGVHAAF